MRLALLAAAFVSVSLTAQQDPDVTKALDYIKANHQRHLDKQVQIAEVAAPTFQEGERARLMAEEFRRVGLKDVEIDSAGNVQLGGDRAQRLTFLSLLPTWTSRSSRE